MLYIDRKEGQSVIVTDSNGKLMRITIIADTEFGIKLGFEAPSDIKIDREEKYNQVRG